MARRKEGWMDKMSEEGGRPYSYSTAVLSSLWKDLSFFASFCKKWLWDETEQGRYLFWVHLYQWWTQLNPSTKALWLKCMWHWCFCFGSGIMVAMKGSFQNLVPKNILKLLENPFFQICKTYPPSLDHTSCLVSLFIYSLQAWALPGTFILFLLPLASFKVNFVP